MIRKVTDPASVGTAGTASGTTRWMASQQQQHPIAFGSDEVAGSNLVQPRGTSPPPLAAGTAAALTSPACTQHLGRRWPASSHSSSSMSTAQSRHATAAGAGSTRRAALRCKPSSSPARAAAASMPAARTQLRSWQLRRRRDQARVLAVQLHRVASAAPLRRASRSRSRLYCDEAAGQAWWAELGS